MTTLVDSFCPTQRQIGKVDEPILQMSLVLEAKVCRSGLGQCIACLVFLFHMVIAYIQYTISLTSFLLLLIRSEWLCAPLVVPIVHSAK
jgi:hypothetical protein